VFARLLSNLNLAVRRHIHRRLRRNRILAPPQTRHRLLLRVELQTRLAVESVRTAARNRLLVASEGEHGELEQSVTVPK
jgi:hypothetical protein